MTARKAQAQRGRLITFEGGEGSGKSTQIKHLSTFLRSFHREVVVTREPGGSLIGERIRSLLLDPEARLDGVTQLLLFGAARRDHVVRLIEPALSQGAWVLCDRFIDSTRAYQGAAGAVDAVLVRTVETAALGETRPDLTLILDIAPRDGLARARRRRGDAASADAYESAGLAFHERVRESFRAIAAAEPERCVLIDAGGSEAEVAAAVQTACRQRLGVGEGRAALG
jgi:dTMP kinase